MKRIETVQAWFMKTKVKTYINIDQEYLSCENLSRWQ
jgi:hypothetical protein